ncbi:MAG: 8-oxo-dGTP diphosphatase [Spirochaetaceae bacterium]|nr:8-oxo-dGTP diphosphatase [Spirochaetaceae bacterium]
MDRIEKVVFMNMCMVYEGTKVLVIDRCKSDWQGITFPGGHVEKNESFVDSVVREIKEETGLSIQNSLLCGIVSWYNKEKDVRNLVYLYKTDSFSGTLVSSDEGKVWWEEIHNLLNLNLTSGMSEYLKVFLDNSLSELHFQIVNGEWISNVK